VGKVQAKDVDAARPYLLMDHFRMEVMARRSRSAGQLVEFVTTFVRFYELVTSVEPKRKALALSTDELKAATQVGHTRPPTLPQTFTHFTAQNLENIFHTRQLKTGGCSDNRNNRNTKLLRRHRPG
jgi:hypothetical protein